MLILILVWVPPATASFIFEVCLGLVLVGFLWSIGQALMQGWANLQRLHQIPCSRCTFFTGDYRLKCTVYPDKALSEEAIDCLDYELAVIRSSN